MAYIELLDIEKSFGTKKILKKVSLSVQKGEFVTFLGPSGCGKTTLLRCLVGLEGVDSGKIIVDGENITDTAANKRGINMIFQQYSLFPTMNVFKNVSFGLRMKSYPKKDVAERVREVLEMVDLQGHEKKYPYQLSGGEQQRVALARCLIMKPKVLLLDEPFSAIDAKLRKELQIYIKQIHRNLDMTSIFVTHDQEEAMRISDTIHLFNDGVLEQSGKPNEVYARPKTPFVAGFIGNYNKIQSKIFARVTGCEFPESTMVAIRPESIKMSSAPANNTNGYFSTRGKVLGSIPQGNVIRYSVGLDDAASIDVDVIFDSDMTWTEGQTVHLQVRKENVLSFATS